MIEDTNYLSVKKDLLQLLSPPCEISIALDGATEIFESGDPPEVMVRLTPDEVQVFRCSFTWISPHELVACPQLLGTVKWMDSEAGLVYRGLIKKGQKQRRHSFRKCRYCGEKLGPEHMHSKDVCQGCAEEHLGIVH